MSEHEQHETDEPEDLELAADDAEQVIGGEVKVSEITITKPVDSASTKLYP